MVLAVAWLQLDASRFAEVHSGLMEFCHTTCTDLEVWSQPWILHLDDVTLSLRNGLLVCAFLQLKTCFGYYKNFDREPAIPDFGDLVAKLYPTLGTTWTVARQTPLSMGFPRQAY